MTDSKSIANFVQLAVQGSIDKDGQSVKISVETERSFDLTRDYVYAHYEIIYSVTTFNPTRWTVEALTKDGKGFSLRVERA